MHAVDTARQRMERVILVAGGIGAVIFTSVLAAGPSGFLAQRTQLEPWFWTLMLIMTTALPLLLIVVVRWSLEAARWLTRVAVLGFIVCHMLWPTAMTVPVLEDGGNPWVQGINALPSTLATVAWRSRWAVIVPLMQGPLVTIVQLNVSSGTTTAAVLDGIGALLFCSIVAAICFAVLKAADAQDEAADRARTQAALDAHRRTQERELSRIDAIVHDDILSVLLTASRPDAPETLSSRAADALSSITRITDPARDAPNAYTASEAIALLRATTADVDPETELSYEIQADLEVPRDAVAALSEALGEALRNCRRHAGSHVRVSVDVTITARAVVVTVDDDGHGFSPRAVSPTRLGIRVSIVDRMASVPGGSGKVSSRPGRGTRVTLAWSQS